MGLGAGGRVGRRAIAVGLLVAAALFAARGAVAQTYTYGIDVSNIQGNITWSSVKNAGALFAFAKATEGVDFNDAKFTQNMTNATAAGVYIGPYHFARVDSNVANPNDAVDEANDFVDAIQSYYVNPGYVLRPVLDVERLAYTDNAGNIAANKAYLSEWVRDFIGVVQTRLHFSPIIYTNTYYASTFFETNLNQYPLWVANYNYSPPAAPPASIDGVWNGWKFWQYSGSGTISGVSGAVDRDVFNGTLTQLVDQFRGVTPNGDFDGDGDKDGADLVAWQKNLGKTGTATHSQGDAEGDRDVDATDLSIWESDFAAAAATAPLTTATPEPASSALAVAAALAGASRKRRRT
jgi:GH25 family lysozyme M1 (1,4-beta-N-acetylmuramidase)